MERAPLVNAAVLTAMVDPEHVSRVYLHGFIYIYIYIYIYV